MPLGSEKRFIRAASGFSATSALRINNAASMDLLGPGTANVSVLFRLLAFPVTGTIAERSDNPAGAQGWRVDITASSPRITLFGSAGSPVFASGPRALVAGDVDKWILFEAGIRFGSATGLQAAMNGSAGAVADISGFTYADPLDQPLHFGVSDSAGNNPNASVAIACYQSAAGEVPLHEITGMFSDRFVATRDAMRLHPLASPIVYADFSRFRGAGNSINDGTVTRGGHFAEKMGGARVEDFLANPCLVADYPADDHTSDWVQP